MCRSELGLYFCTNLSSRSNSFSAMSANSAMDKNNSTSTLMMPGMVRRMLRNALRIWKHDKWKTNNDSINKPALSTVPRTVLAHISEKESLFLVRPTCRLSLKLTIKTGLRIRVPLTALSGSLRVFERTMKMIISRTVSCRLPNRGKNTGFLEKKHTLNQQLFLIR